MERNDLEFCFTKCTLKSFSSSHSNYIELTRVKEVVCFTNRENIGNVRCAEGKDHWSRWVGVNNWYYY